MKQQQEGLGVQFVVALRDFIIDHLSTAAGSDQALLVVASCMLRLLRDPDLESEDFSSLFKHFNETVSDQTSVVF